MVKVCYMLQIIDPRVEYRANPIGVFTEKPRFSWKIHTDKKNLLQTAYSIEVAESPDFSSPLWKSGEIRDDRSHLVTYGGVRLRSSASYFWRVKIRDNHGEESPWSETAFFETTLLAACDWHAFFVTAEGEDAGASSAAYILRREFTAARGVRRARLYASAKGMFVPYLNGQKVGDGVLSPGWTEYASRLLFETYDVTAMLADGANALGVMVGPGWYKGDLAGWLGKRNIYGTRTAVIAQLHLEYEDGRVEIVASDTSWKCDRAPVVYSELYHGETYDARLEQEGWNRGGFDDSTWQPVAVESSDMSILKPHDGVPVKEGEIFKPVSLFTTPGGDRVIDFGQNISGWVRFKVAGKAGDVVKLRHAETLDTHGNFYTDNLRKARQTIEYVLSGKDGGEVYNPYFTFQGFRYTALDLWPGDINLEDIEARAIYSDMRPAGEFSCSHAKLNKFVENVRWSMKDNFVDVPTDCPQRDERLGWTGDAHVFMNAANYLMETAPFFKKWLRDLTVSQFEDGRVPHVVPNVLNDINKFDGMITGEAGATAWADAAVGVPWSLYLSFADIGILEEQYPSMKKWIDYIRTVSTDGLLFNVGFHFGDWVALDANEGSYFGATPNDLVATAFYAYSANILSKTAALLGKKDDAEKYAKLRADIGRAYGKEFFTNDGTLVARTQTAHILSLAFDLTPPEFKGKTIDALVGLIAEKDNHLTTGFAGTPYVLQALTDNGRAELALDLMLKEDFPSWLYQINKGATTIWEHWDGIKPDGSMWSSNMNSFNHYAYGSVCDWVFRVVGGIDTDREKVAYKRSILRPAFVSDRIRRAETVYESVYGKVSVSWERKDETVLVEVTVPPNTGARLTLPGAKAGSINGVDFTEADGGAAAELGSGLYSFVYQVA